MPTWPLITDICFSKVDLSNPLSFCADEKSHELVNEDGVVMVEHLVLYIDGFHSIFHHRNWRAKVSCDADINQSTGSMVT